MATVRACSIVVKLENVTYLTLSLGGDKNHQGKISVE
jgi:hypothetical protein